MFTYTYPIFERKRLLKNEMLENLRDFPRDLVGVFYQSHSNGIISGVDISTIDNYIQISPGILYWNGIPYIMQKEIKLLYKETGTVSYLKVKFLEKLSGTEKQEHLTQIYIDEHPIDKLREMELARFKLQKGARLRDTYTDFFDLNTEYDTINRIYAPCSSSGKHTVLPFITKFFVRELLNSPINNLWDSSFCINCLQSERGMNYEVIKTYLNVRLQDNRTDYNNYETYIYLGRILNEAAGKGPASGKEKRADKKMLLL